MNKFFSLLLVVVFSVAVIGCGGADEVKKKAGEAAKKTKEAGGKAVEKAKKGDVKGATGEAGKGVKEVSKVLTGKEEKKAEPAKTEEKK